ncbi:hypothetical protein VP01_16g7 [Puccinia sorghi]|uniref:HMG box domain-containing protein n=1 Tax=Puccinia sorghi TaxID=27349 RepID=A0A0L6VFL3_9BASI|nr:hypothetical protein VP01_16g7 [Puccinia sorghi]
MSIESSGVPLNSKNTLFGLGSLFSSSASARSRSSPPRLSIDGAFCGSQMAGSSADTLGSSNGDSGRNNRFADDGEEAQNTGNTHQYSLIPSDSAVANNPFSHSLIPTIVTSSGTENVQTPSAYLMTPEIKPSISEVGLIDFDLIKEFNLNDEPRPNQTSPASVIGHSAGLKSNHHGEAVAKKKEEKLPRPPNSWILYRSDKIVEMKSQHNGLAQCLLSKEIAAKWHSESPEVKNNYEKKAELIKAEHAIKYPDYKYSPKRRKPADTSKAGQKKKSAGAASPQEKSKRKESSSSGGSKNLPTHGSRKRKASYPADNSSAQEESSLPTLDAEAKSQLIHPGDLEDNLYSAYPALGKLAAATEIQSQRALASADYGNRLPSIESPIDAHPFNQQLLGQAPRFGPSGNAPLYPRQPSNVFGSQGFVPVAQSRPELQDYGRLDPQLQYENHLASLASPSTSGWPATLPDISTQSFQGGAPSLLGLSANHRQPDSPNPRDFGLLPDSLESPHFTAPDPDWMNPYSLPYTWNGSLLGPSFARATLPGVSSSQDAYPLPDEPLDPHAFSQPSMLISNYP